MAFINLTGKAAQFPLAYENNFETLCTVCSQPFKHTVKASKNKQSNELVHTLHTAHPHCKRACTKAEKIKEKIINVKKKLHDLRAEQLNLEFEMFCKQQLKLDDDTDEIFVVLKEKDMHHS
jgi:hypothetical protein